MFRRNKSTIALIKENHLRGRRPSLPCLLPPISDCEEDVGSPMSSIGKVCQRRPSLIDTFHNGNDSNHFMHPVDYVVFHAYYQDHDESNEIIRVYPGMRLYEAFEESLRARGLTVNDVCFFVDKSSTPIPENSDAQWLSGRKINVRSEWELEPKC
ncbi:hypothetical protein WR25_16576 [Diploscapter pachys]|uniref:RBD domain-containing protein n=1 Tax=Diploscapter pachys TaxID=2018661 RepID=A0A2A2LAH6_9BILA|nr:hypothetical protein WR25_16576 [Diploscapter pachys]